MKLLVFIDKNNDICLYSFSSSNIIHKIKINYIIDYFVFGDNLLYAISQNNIIIIDIITHKKIKEIFQENITYVKIISKDIYLGTDNKIITPTKQEIDTTNITNYIITSNKKLVYFQDNKLYVYDIDLDQIIYTNDKITQGKLYEKNNYVLIHDNGLIVFDVTKLVITREYAFKGDIFMDENNQIIVREHDNVYLFDYVLGEKKELGRRFSGNEYNIMRSDDNYILSYCYRDDREENHVVERVIYKENEITYSFRTNDMYTSDMIIIDL